MKIEVYGKDTCPYCVKAKQLLKEKNLPFTDVKVGVDVTREQVQQLAEAAGAKVEIKSIPQIIIDGKYIGGYTDLVNFLK
jgi:glutaredoxin